MLINKNLIISIFFSIVLSVFVISNLEVTVSLSNSMEPKIMTNSIIIAEKLTKWEDLKVGDIISYQVQEVEGKTVMHRIKQKAGNIGFLTSGDNNQNYDNWTVKEENYKNKYLMGFNWTSTVVNSLYQKGLTVKEVTTIAAVVLILFILTLNTVILFLIVKIMKGVLKMLGKNDFYMVTEHRRKEKKGRVKFNMVINKILISSLVIGTLATGSLPVYAQDNISSKSYKMATVEQMYHKSIDNIIYEINSTISQLKDLGRDKVTKVMLSGLINQVKEMEEIYNKDYDIEKEKVVDVLDIVIAELGNIKNTKEELKAVNDIRARILKLERVQLTNPKAAPINLSDISTHWGKSTIQKLVNRGAISGYPDATFKPDNTITRAEFLAISLRSTTTVEPTKQGEPWYLGVYNTALKEGVITRAEFKIEDMDKAITRQEMSKVMVKISENILGETKTDATGVSEYISDYNSISTSYRQYIEQTYMKGIVTGYPDNSFKATNTGTRAEASTMLLRLIEKDMRTDISKKEVPKPGVRQPMILHQNDSKRPMAIEGDTFVKADGTKVVLKVDEQTGILGLGQGVATEIGRVDERGSAIKHGSLGIIDEFLGSPYYVDNNTGMGLYRSQWLDIQRKIDPYKEVKDPVEGQVYKEYFKFRDGIWTWLGQ